jgi:hypothetical protein
MSNSWEISKLKGPHTCQNLLVLQLHRQINPYLIAKVMLTIIKKDLSTKVAMIQGTIKMDYEHEVFY